MPPSSTLPSTQIPSKCWSLGSWKMESKSVSITKRNSWALNLRFCCPCAIAEAGVRLCCKYESLKAVTYSLDWQISFAVSRCFCWHASYQCCCSDKRSGSKCRTHVRTPGPEQMSVNQKVFQDETQLSNSQKLFSIRESNHQPWIPFSILQPTQIWGYWLKSNLLGRDMVELLGCYASLPSIFDRFRFQSIVESMSGVEYCRVEHGSFSFSNFQVQDGSAQ